VLWGERRKGCEAFNSRRGVAWLQKRWDTICPNGCEEENEAADEAESFKLALPEAGREADDADDCYGACNGCSEPRGCSCNDEVQG
jgi:hypothetical protein